MVARTTRGSPKKERSPISLRSMTGSASCTATAAGASRTMRRHVYIPAHHDADRNGMWRPTEPIFEAFKEEDPKLITISKQYREPICFDTKNDVQRGKRK